MKKENWGLAITLVAILIIVLIGLVFVVTSTNKEKEKTLPYSISRFIDSEAGVVYYYTTGGYQGGIDCLLITETQLGSK